MSDQLVPKIEYDLTDAFQYEEQPGFTYKLHIGGKRIGGYVDDLEAYKQAVYKILSTERYTYIIYSWNYGVELKELIGKHPAYVIPEIERRVTEALMQDDRTERVDSFEFDTSKGGVVSVTFTAHSIYGEAKIQTTVVI
jgi:phage baseplate assembly protein W